MYPFPAKLQMPRATTELDGEPEFAGMTMPRSDVEEQYIWHARAASQMPTAVKIRVYLLLLYNYLEAFDAVNAAESKLELAFTASGRRGAPELPFVEKQVTTCRRELQRAYKTFSLAGRF